MRKLLLAIFVFSQLIWALDRQPNSDFRIRRQSLASKASGAAVLLFASNEAEGPNDLYGYRPDDNFFYLTGWSEPGAAFMFKTQPYPGWDGTVNCKMLEVEEQKKISYAWVVGGEMGLNTVVTFTLTPTASGTRLSLVQSGFKPAQKQNFGGARYGWKMMGDKLVNLLGRLH
jgi:hypothetical protein